MIDDETAEAVVNAYRRGVKIRDIERQFNIPRSTLYWLLERKQVTPDRVKRNVRLRGDDHQLAALYELIQAQDERIQVLLQLLEQHGVEIPPEDANNF